MAAGGYKYFNLGSTSGGGGTYDPHFGSFYDTTTQTTLGNTPEAMRLNTTDISDGFTIVSGSRITAAYAGVYDVQFSAQVQKTQGGSSEDIYIWPRVNGINVPVSSTKLTLANNGVFIVPAWNFFLNLSAGDYVELMWYATDSHIELFYEASPVAGAVPAIPSVILTINKIN